jgi:hypothetical protein
LTTLATIVLTKHSRRLTFTATETGFVRWYGHPITNLDTDFATGGKFVHDLKNVTEYGCRLSERLEIFQFLENFFS